MILTNNRRHGANNDETSPDYYVRLKDSKGNWILCHECGHGSGIDKAIIQCNYCVLSWHLDCLDPPLANPPNPPHTDRKWRCPCHVDELLAKVPGVLGPAHRFRRIKGASVIKPAIPRGTRNNGHIEIEMDSSEEEEAEEEDTGFFQQREYGHIYKLPEEGIKLDFISRWVTLRDDLMTAIRTTMTDILQGTTRAQENQQTGHGQYLHPAALS
jgi:hypothetical protein